ncbi:MAG: DUF503 domain-containing protein [Acidimicrobiia bacterium]
MIVAALRFELHIPDSESLKSKRAVIRPLIEGLRRAASVSVSEVDHHDTWQRCALGVALVTPDPGSMDRLIERVRRYVDENMEVHVVDCSITFVELDT